MLARVWIGAGLVVATSLCLRMPVQATTAPSAGAALFHDKGCEHCHGVGGVGGERGPDLRGVGRRMTSAQISRQIHDGGANMPPFGDALDASELKLLSEYLAKQKAKVAATPNQ